MEDPFETRKGPPSFEEQVNQRATEILRDQGVDGVRDITEKRQRRERLEEKISTEDFSSDIARPKAPSPPVEIPVETYQFRLGDSQLIYDRTPFLARQNALPFCTLNMAATIMGPTAARWGHGSVCTLWGASSIYLDGREFSESRSTLEKIKYGSSIAADSVMLAGGVTRLGAYGPKWLGPLLLLGGIGGRLLADAIPNEIRKK